MNDTQKEKKYTTTAVKREWNKAHYTQIKCSLPKELAKQFRETAKARGDAQSSIIREAIIRYLSE